MFSDSHRQVLVFVTDQFCCEALIHRGHQLALKNHTSLAVVSIQPKSRPAKGNAQALRYLRQVSKGYRTDMAICYHDDPIACACAYVDRADPLVIVTGAPRGSRFTQALAARYPAVPLIAVQAPPLSRAFAQRPFAQALWANVVRALS